MKLQFLGAAKTVTGSSFLVEVAGRKILVDCGMFQGRKSIRNLNYRDFAYSPSELDCVVLTHAHIDHCGLLPKLCREGFKGRIHATKVTTELCSIMLPDSAYIQESDAELANRKGQRSGKALVEPLYTSDDAAAALEHFTSEPYDQDILLTPEVRIRFRDAGHIIGSAIVEMYVTEDGKTTKLVFSGDIGQPDQPIIKDPTFIDGADYVVTESTYGNRVHMHYYKEENLIEIIEDTIARGGNVIIPAFAVGRTQTMLYYLHKLWREGKIEPVPVVIDSPLAIAATQVFARNTDVYDEESKAVIDVSGGIPEMPHLKIAKTMEESRALNNMPGSKIIISASGMADAGRVLHHLKHNLWRPESSILFVGYQAEGSMGRRLIDGIKRVKIMGEEVNVKAKIYNLEGYSAHADRNQIVEWLQGMNRPKPCNIFIVHGEPDAAEAMACLIDEKIGVPFYIPDYGDSALIDGLECKIEKSNIVIEPVARDLEEYLNLVEAEYMRLKKRLIKLVLRNPSRLNDITARVEKAVKYMKKLMNDL